MIRFAASRDEALKRFPAGDGPAWDQPKKSSCSLPIEA
jgi:hypothetical protein